MLMADDNPDLDHGDSGRNESRGRADRRLLALRQRPTQSRTSRSIIAPC